MTHELEDTTELYIDMCKRAVEAREAAQEILRYVKSSRVRAHFKAKYKWLIEEEKYCTCHERDNSYVCDYCKSQGYKGHMEGSDG